MTTKLWHRPALTTLTAAALCAVASVAHANVVISSGATSNMSCSAGVCTATAVNAVLNIQDLQTMLASSDVTVRTGSIAVNIVSGPFSWASAHSLTLDAFRSVVVNRRITVSGTGGLALKINDGGGGGELLFREFGSIAFWGTSNALTINTVPYTLVSSIAALAGAIAANPSGNFALSANYDARPDGTYSASPIPTGFSGNLQGLGNTISNLKILDSTRGRNVGLFSSVLAGGSIDNLRITNASVGNGARKSLAGLVAVNGGTIYNVSVAGALRAGAGTNMGEVAGINNGSIIASLSSGSLANTGPFGAARPSLGGLVGTNAGNITSSSSSADVNNGQAGEGGGLVGIMLSGTIVDSSASGNVSGDVAGGLIYAIVSGSVTDSHATGSVTASSAGGFVSNTFGGTIVDCYSTGNVTTTSTGETEAGAFVASNGGLISQSFATGTVSVTVSSGSHGGGFAGYQDKSGVIENSYATGAVSGGVYGGGFVGETTNTPQAGATVTAAYSTGAATGGTHDGGFVGFNQYPAGQNYTAAYWNTTTSGTSQAIGTGNSAPITGLTSAQLQSGLPAGFDPAIWGQSPTINNGFPYLLANPPPQG